MLTLESAVWIVARAFLGVFLPIVLLGVAWVLSRLFLQYLTLEATTIYITQSLIIGIPAGIGAVVAWWNLEAPATLKVIAALTVPPATALCAWLSGGDSRRLYLLRLAWRLSPRPGHRHRRPAKHRNRRLRHRRQCPCRRAIPLPLTPIPRSLTHILPILSIDVALSVYVPIKFGLPGISVQSSPELSCGSYPSTRRVVSMSQMLNALSDSPFTTANPTDGGASMLF